MARQYSSIQTEPPRYPGAQWPLHHPDKPSAYRTSWSKDILDRQLGEMGGKIDKLKYTADVGPSRSLALPQTAVSSPLDQNNEARAAGAGDAAAGAPIGGTRSPRQFYWDEHSWQKNMDHHTISVERPDCNRCKVRDRQVAALAQALAGLGAATFNWSAGMPGVERQDLAGLILDYLQPCALLHDDVKTLCTEVEQLVASGTLHAAGPGEDYTDEGAFSDQGLLGSPNTPSYHSRSPSPSPDMPYPYGFEKDKQLQVLQKLAPHLAPGRPRFQAMELRARLAYIYGSRYVARLLGRCLRCWSVCIASELNERLLQTRLDESKMEFDRYANSLRRREQEQHIVMKRYERQVEYVCESYRQARLRLQLQRYFKEWLVDIRDAKHMGRDGAGRKGAKPGAMSSGRAWAAETAGRVTDKVCFIFQASNEQGLLASTFYLWSVQIMTALQQRLERFQEREQEALTLRSRILERFEQLTTLLAEQGEQHQVRNLVSAWHAMAMQGSWFTRKQEQFNRETEALEQDAMQRIDAHSALCQQLNDRYRSRQEESLMAGCMQIWSSRARLQLKLGKTNVELERHQKRTDQALELLRAWYSRRCDRMLSRDVFSRWRAETLAERLAYEKKKAGFIDNSVPKLLWVDAPNADTTKGFDNLVSGRYELIERRKAGGLPVWHQEGGSHWLFSGSNGHWLIGDEHEESQNFRCETGVVGSYWEHDGAMPHEIKRGPGNTEAWLWFTSWGEWEEDNQFFISATPQQPLQPKVKKKEIAPTAARTTDAESLPPPHLNPRVLLALFNPVPAKPPARPRYGIGTPQGSPAASPATSGKSVRTAPRAKSSNAPATKRLII